MNVDLWQLEQGNCKELIKDLEDNSIDSIVTDPPYELGFMGKKWDNSGIAYDVELWSECLRVLKHGGHLLAFSGSRTYHRMAVAIEDAGFEIRDQIQWVYGSGFPKSHNIGKAIDKMQGAERVVIESIFRGNNGGKKNGIMGQTVPRIDKITAPATPDAKQWDGWGTALKPAHEPICVARKPLIGTVAENVLKYGTGGINIDGCRVGIDGGCAGAGLGRFPANFIHDGSEEVLAGFPETISKWGQSKPQVKKRHPFIGFAHNPKPDEKFIGDRGSASRFFYCAKASKKDRDEGCEGMEINQHQSGMRGSMPIDDDGKNRDRFVAKSHNHHPTVKPTDLMRYLCRLVTPPNGIILDPFTGSGSTGKAAILEGFRFVGFDMQSEYIDIASARIKDAEKKINSKLF